MGGGKRSALVLSFLPHWGVSAPTTELDVKKELKQIGSQSVQVGVHPRVEHRRHAPWPGPGHAQLSHRLLRNAARLECKAGVQMSHTDQELWKPKVSHKVKGSILRD